MTKTARPTHAAKTNWFDPEEPSLVDFTSEIFEEEKTSKQALKAARVKTIQEALEKEPEMEASGLQYPEGEFYTLTSNFADLETGQLVLVVSLLLANARKNHYPDKKVDVVVVYIPLTSTW